jgi:uncharacterized membrane protein HdeD (DUF308 family)
LRISSPNRIGAVAHFIFSIPVTQRWWLPLEALARPRIGIRVIYMLMHPSLGLVSLTLVLAAFLFIEGVIETVFYFNIRKVPNSGWVLLDGIITLILGLLIWANWPSVSAWVVGTLVGVSLIFSGISRFTLPLAIRDVSRIVASL